VEADLKITNRQYHLIVIFVALALVIPLSGCYADYVFRETFLKSETAYSPSVQGKITDKDGNPIDGASVVVGWAGNYSSGMAPSTSAIAPFMSLFEREEMSTTYETEYLHSNAEGGFTIPSWQKQQGSTEGYIADWPGYLVIVIVEPGYRPEIYLGGSKYYVPLYNHSKLVSKAHIDSRLDGRLEEKDVELSSIRLKPVETIEEAMTNMLQVEEYLTSWPFNNDARIQETTRVYLKDLLIKYPEGPQSKEATDFLLANRYYSFSLLQLCEDIQKTDINEMERGAAIKWILAFETIRQKLKDGQ
jgi:hypothetical protein